MRILWFTNTPSKAGIEFGYNTYGGGWISSLESLIVGEKTHELGICFFYSGAKYKKLIKDGVSYYGIPLEQQSGLKRIVSRHKGKLNDTHSAYIDFVINDFSPNLVHVFGTEMGYGELLIGKFDKVLFHLQGLVMPYTHVYFPNGFSKKEVIKNSGLMDILRGLTFYHNYITFKNKADREIRIMKKWKYFSGRTDWDRNYTALINPASTYFHCEELLRNSFFLSQWTAPSQPGSNVTIVIGTTINPNIYKGLDLIYKILPLLENYTICWKIFGLTANNSLNKMVKKILPITDEKKSINFYGHIDAENLIEELKTCHFFVHPSYIDNSPNSVCESMLLGMPVLSSSVGGVKSLIQNKENGFLFNPYDKYDLAGLLVFLIKNYDLAILAASKARLTAMQRHSPNEIIKTLNNIYTSIYND